MFQIKNNLLPAARRLLLKGNKINIAGGLLLFSQKNPCSSRPQEIIQTDNISPIIISDGENKV